MNALNTPENVVMHPRASAEYLSVADTAKLMRAALKDAFPRVKFSVRSKSYSGGASITVSWFDGPTTKDVDAIAQAFSGADFDGMQDLKTYHPSMLNGRPVHFGADFVFTQRSLSPEFLSLVVREVCGKYDLPVPVISVSEYDGSAHIAEVCNVMLPDHIRRYGNDRISDLVYRELPNFREVTL